MEKNQKTPQVTININFFYIKEQMKLILNNFQDKIRNTKTAKY